METQFSSLLPIKLVLKNVTSIKEQIGFLIPIPESHWAPSSYRICEAGAASPKVPVGGHFRQSRVLCDPPILGGKRKRQNHAATSSQITSPWMGEWREAWCGCYPSFLHPEGDLTSEVASSLTHYQPLHRNKSAMADPNRHLGSLQSLGSSFYLSLLLVLTPTLPFLLSLSPLHTGEWDHDDVLITVPFSSPCRIQT